MDTKVALKLLDEIEKNLNNFTKDVLDEYSLWDVFNDQLKLIDELREEIEKSSIDNVSK